MIRDPTIILTDYTTYTLWRLQLQARYEQLDLWSKIDPEGDEDLLEKPLEPSPPDVAQYEPLATLVATLGDDFVPMRPF